VGATLSASVLFFIVTNFSVWLLDGLYPLTFEGLMASYTAAIPFFRNAVLGDLFYAAVLFGGLALAERQLTWMREAPLARAG
jgi:formate-dependent nitrite reductase membrane component NrfD